MARRDCVSVYVGVGTCMPDCVHMSFATALVSSVGPFRS